MAKLYTRKSDGTYVPYNPQSVTNIDVVQTTGNSVTAAMSQDAVTKELADKQDTLTTGNGISIERGVIGVTTITESESQPTTNLWVNPSEDEETDVTYNRSQIDAMVGAKQDALQLTVKDNGNIVLSNIQGQSKEFMPATPSGDPMHYAYEAAGAVWNGTGADIVKTTPWADLADDDADKTVVHKAGYWYLNGLGDITNEQMRKIYAVGNIYGYIKIDALLRDQGADFVRIRTNICNGGWGNNVSHFNQFGTLQSIQAFCYNNKTIECCMLTPTYWLSNKSLAISAMFRNAFYGSNIEHIVGFILGRTSNFDTTTFGGSYFLKTISIVELNKNISFHSSGNLSVKSILYMIQNEAATSAITITLHADAYARAMANADIVAALEAHPNVSLASA